MGRHVGVGVAAGPITGGWLLEHFLWGSIFLVNVPVAAVAIVGGISVRSDFTRPGGPAARRRGLDPVRDRRDRPGVHRHRGTQLGLDAAAHTVAGFGVAAAVLAAFALWERRTPHPMLDVSVFANRRFSGGSLAVTAGFLTLFGFIFVITQYFQFIKDYSAFETGVRMLPVAVSIAVASVLGPRLVERIGTTAVVAARPGHLRRRPGMGVHRRRGTPYIQIAMQMVLLGGGLGLTTAPATESIMGSLSADKAGVGSAVNDTTRELGGTLGVAIVGSVFASVYSGRLGSASAMAALPGDVRSTMEHSMAAAYKVIGQLPAARDAGVRDAVDNAFLDGLQVGSLFCAAIALGAAVVVAGLLPARARQTAPSMTRNRKRAAIHEGKNAAQEVPNTAYTATWSDGRGEVKFFTRPDGSRLRYFTAGTGPSLVLLHTVRTQLDYFQRVIPLLWDSFTVYAVDLPGMGWSDIVPGARYEQPDLHTAVVEFVTGLDLYDVTLAGESLGAALRYPHRST